MYDGIDDGQRLIQHSCGPHFAWPHFPDAVRSSSNAITLVFITDGNQTGKGYEARFKTVAQEPSIFVLAAQDKNRLHVIRRHSALNYGLVPDGIQSPQAVDYDPVEGFVYYSDIATKVIGRLPVLGGETQILHKKQISNPFALRIDIVNRLLYWSDADMATISVSNLEGTQRQTLIDSELHKPGAIVQEPNEGYIYFTDWGHPAKIEAAAGDGTLRTTIVTERISSPQGLTIDLNTRLLYWVDTLLDTLEMVSVSGNNRQVVRRFHERDPFSIVLDNEAFFFTDEEWGAIELHDRESVTPGFRVYIGSIREPRGLTLRPLHDYGNTVPYTCPRADCNDLCLPMPNDFYVCSQVKPLLFNCPNDIMQMSPNDRVSVTWTEPIAYSPKGLDITTTKSNSPSEEFSVGIHHVSYKFEDTLCNRVYCNFTVSIITPHMIFCPEDIYKKVPKGVTEVEVLWVPPTDTQGRPATFSTHSPGAMFSLGTTVVTYSATYDNIYEECSFSIFVEQVESPGPVFLNCPSSIVKWVKKGETFAFVSWSSIELVDEAHIIDENHWMENGGKFFTDSVEIVHLRARDEFDNVADCNFTVEVKVDDEKPQITNCPKDISIRSTKDREFVDWRKPSASDNSGSVNITLEDGPSPGSTIAVGSMTVTYLAQDPYGNAATCTFIVEVSVADAGLPSGIDAQNSVKVSGNDNDLNMLLIIIIGSAIAALLLLILCALVFLLYRCRRKPAREIQRTNSLPPEYNYAVAEPVNSVSLGVSGGRVQYRVAVPDDEPLYDTAAVGLPPAYEEEKKVDLADEKDIPPGYQ